MLKPFIEIELTSDDVYKIVRLEVKIVNDVLEIEDDKNFVISSRAFDKLKYLFNKPFRISLEEQYQFINTINKNFTVLNEAKRIFRIVKTLTRDEELELEIEEDLKIKNLKNLFTGIISNDIKKTKSLLQQLKDFLKNWELS